MNALEFLNNKRIKTPTVNTTRLPDSDLGLHSVTDLMDEYLEYKLKNLSQNLVSNPLPTKEEVIVEGDKQIKDWLMGNSFEERTAYRIGFRRSFEYVLRFIK